MVEGLYEYAGMKRTVQVIGWVLTFASIYAICNIELDWFWSIPVRYNPENINRVLLNLSYSYLAGYLFYLLVTEIPYWQRNREFRKIITEKYKILKYQIESNIQAFGSNKTNLLNTITLKELTDLIQNVNITDVAFQAKEVDYKTNILVLLNGSRNTIIHTCHEILNVYKDYLTESEVVTIEKICSAQYFNFIYEPNPHSISKLTQLYYYKSKDEIANLLYEVIELVRKLK